VKSTDIKNSIKVIRLSINVTQITIILETTLGFKNMNIKTKGSFLFIING